MTNRRLPGVAVRATIESVKGLSARFGVVVLVAGLAFLSSCARRETFEVTLYYQTLCPSCGEDRDNQVLLSLLAAAARSSTRTTVKLSAWDIAVSANVDRLQRQFDEAGVPDADRRVPIAFAGGAYYAGVTAIEELAQVLRSR